MEGAAAGDRVGARGGGAAAGEGAAGLPEEGEGSGAPLSGDAWLENQTQRVFSGIAELAGGELRATAEEFQLLENVNRVAAARYAEIADTVGSLEGVMQEIVDQHASLATHVAEIEAVDKSVRGLEDTVAALDAYTAKLAAAASSALEKSP